jgi:MFS family permease
MTPTERRATFALSAIFGLRMMGLFLILPVFALYAVHLQHVTPTLIGVAIGAYGLSQAFLQIPFGMLSDRFGRKSVITVGLLIFAVGSAVAAVSHSIWGVILGRALQGAGAIAAAVMALAADLTREEQRTKAMAMIGMTIGTSFAVAIVAAPVINHFIGVPGIFWMVALLALAAIVVLHTQVPSPDHITVHRDAEAVPGQIGGVLRNPGLLRLDFGILALHTILTANWVVLPVALRAHLPTVHHWWVYLPVLVLSVAAMVPFIIVAERKQRMKQVFLGAVVTLGLAELGLSQGFHTLGGIAVALFAFFTAFNLLEATLPSLISKVAPSAAKGTAMGVYSTSQFFGAFLGGSLGGWINGHYGVEGVFIMGACVAAVWAVVASGMANPRALKSLLLHVGEVSEEEARQLAKRLTGVSGVAEAVVIAGDGTAYLKVDSRNFDEQALERLVGQGQPSTA